MSDVAAVILAAGLGTRLGRGPKAFVVFEGQTLLQRATALIAAAGISRVCAVLPPAPDPGPLPSGLMNTRNPDPTSSPLVSVGLAMERLAEGGGFARLLVHHVDHPHVESADLSALLVGADQAPTGVSRVVLSWEGKGGHPIIITESGLQAVRKSPASPEISLRTVLAGAGAAHYVAGRSSGVVLNWNTPEDLLAEDYTTTNEGEP